MFSDSSKNRYILLASIISIFCIGYYDLLLGKKIFIHDSIIWYGSFHYYIDSFVRGVFPYWDPYLTTGTYFYPNIPHHGLLDPAVLIGALFSRVLNFSPLTIYTYTMLFR